MYYLGFDDTGGSQPRSNALNAPETVGWKVNKMQVVTAGNCRTKARHEI